MLSGWSQKAILLAVLLVILTPVTALARTNSSFAKADANLAEGHVQARSLAGTLSQSFTLVGKSSDPRWWGPPAIDTPGYCITIDAQSDRSESWTTTIRGPLATSDPYPLEVPTRYSRYLKPDTKGLIQSGNPEIVGLARSLVQGCAWESDAVARIGEWIDANITYDYSVTLPYDALSVLHNRSGICEGYSNLATALLRAAHIPAITTGGAVLWGENDLPLPHAWNAILYPSAGWVLGEPQGSLVNYLDTTYAYLAPPNIELCDITVGEATGDFPEEVIVHSPPAVSPPPIVSIEDDPSGEHKQGIPTERCSVRASITGSSHAVWMTWKLDGQVFDDGGLDGHAMYQHEYESEKYRGLPTGKHTISLDVEDVWGQHGEGSLVITLPVAIPTIALKLRGLTSGVTGVGKRVVVRGTVAPANLAGSKVTLRVQKKGARWFVIKRIESTIRAGGACSWAYTPAKKGLYRVDAYVPETKTHYFAGTPWATFKVK